MIDPAPPPLRPSSKPPLTDPAEIGRALRDTQADVGLLHSALGEFRRRLDAQDARLSVMDQRLERIETLVGDIHETLAQVLHRLSAPTAGA